MRDAAFDQLLVTWLAEGPTRPPEGPVEAAIAHARAHPSRPSRRAWRMLPVGSLPEAVPRPVPGGARTLAWVALVALVLVTFVGLLLVGGLGRREAPPDRAAPTLAAVVAPARTPAPAPASAGPTLTPTPLSTPGGRIAYTSRGILRVLDLATGESANVAGAPVDAIVGGWSPDGSSLGYWTGADASTAPDLWFARGDGTDPRLVMEAGEAGGTPLGHEFGVSWSPDGSSIAVTTFIGWAVNAARLMDLGGAARDIPEEPVLHKAYQGYAGPVIAPDGQRVAMALAGAFGHLGRGVAVVPADPRGTAEPELLEATVEAGDMAPASIGWEGTDALRFVAGEALWEVQADGTQLIRLTPAEVHVRRAATAPDGSLVAFVATRDGEDGVNLYVMPSGGTLNHRGFTPAWLIRAAGVCPTYGREVTPLAWSPDGAHVAFLAAGYVGGSRQCRVAWIPSQTSETMAVGWRSPGFYDPERWQDPTEVEPTVADAVADVTPIAWGPAAP